MRSAVCARMFILLLLLGARPASADPSVDDLAVLCTSAERLSRGAAAFGCDIVKTLRSEVEADFPAFLENGCIQAAAVASFEKCSADSDAVKFGYKLQCEEVKKACGCATDKCTQPGKIPFGSYAVVEVGSSCTEPITVKSPPALAWAAFDIGLAILIGIGNGATNSKILESVADPSGKLYASQQEWLLLMMKLDDVPFDKYLTIELSDGSKSGCLVKRPGGTGWFLWNPLA